jgi:hypothetical protein
MADKHVDLVLASKDAAMALLNAAMSKQAVNLDGAEVYEVGIENMGFYDSWLSMAGFPYPAPGAKLTACMLRLPITDEDDASLVEQNINHYFGLDQQKNVDMKKFEQLAKRKNYPIDLVAPTKFYARMILPVRDVVEDGTVQAFVGYDFKPSRAAVAQLRLAYPGLEAVCQELLPAGSMPQKPVSVINGDAPGMEVFKRMLRERNGTDFQPPGIEDMNFSKLLLHVYDPQSERTDIKLDLDLLKGSAPPDVSNPVPVVVRMDYKDQLVRSSKDRKFRTGFEAIEDSLKNMLDRPLTIEDLLKD